MNEKGETVDELLICYKFPPSQRVSGVVSAKRLIKSQRTVDVIQSIDEEKLDYKFNKVVNKFTNKRYFIECNEPSPTWPSIKEFNEEGLKALEEEETYKKIHSRAGSHESHFFALEYKLKHPETFWRAEFSDPLSITIENKKRVSRAEIYIKDDDYLDRINWEIANYGKNYKKYFNRSIDDGDFKIENLDLRNIDEDFTIYELCEYLPFLFADEIVFTNENQMELMIGFYPEIKELVKSKSIVQHHPVLDEEYYHTVESKYQIDENYINFGYFGTYLGRRHLENLFYAFESLNSQFKDKYRIHIFAQDRGTLINLLKNLNIADNVTVKYKIPLLEFLNLTTQFDVLIVNDLNTSNNFDKNPFLPSKLSDYIGSGKDIWAIYEKGSVMSTYDIKYKSDVSDYEDSLNTLKEIFKDKIDLEKENIDIDSIEGNLGEYLLNRVYQLNSVIEGLENQKRSATNKAKKALEEVEIEKKKNEELNEKIKIETNNQQNKNKKLKEKIHNQQNKNKKLKEKIHNQQNKNKKLKKEIK